MGVEVQRGTSGSAQESRGRVCMRFMDGDMERMTQPMMSREDAFTDFVTEVGPRLKQALVSSLGGEVGRESTAEALAYAWEHWERIQGMANPAGYLYRVGKSRGVAMYRRSHREVGFPQPAMAAGDPPRFEPGLPAALGKLSERQRLVVMLVNGYAWTHREVAELLRISVGSVQRHAERGLGKLRKTLRVGTDV